MKKTRVLFVCMGNICRSPAAEGVFRHLVRQRGLEDAFHIDSAGTIGYHAGQKADSRMRQAAQRRGVSLDSLARQVTARDLEDFDLILAADRDNLFHLHSLDRDGRHEGKIKLLASWHPDPSIEEVPDPYYGGPEGFEHVLDLLEAACARLLEELSRPGAQP